LFSKTSSYRYPTPYYDMFGDLSTFVLQHGLVPATAGLPFVLDSTTNSNNINNNNKAHAARELILQLRGGAEQQQQHTPPLFEDIFESHPSIDYSDNNAQARVIKHHYMNEFGKHISMKAVMEDYSDSVVIHEVVDNVPKTYRGHEGVRRAFRDMYRKIPHDTSHFEFEHIAIDHDHAQVVWKATIPDRDVIIQGMDSFAFDKDNRIIKQSIMAISSERPPQPATSTTDGISSS
jgi:hypothetical protein